MVAKHLVTDRLSSPRSQSRRQHPSSPPTKYSNQSVSVRYKDNNHPSNTTSSQHRRQFLELVADCLRVVLCRSTRHLMLWYRDGQVRDSPSECSLTIQIMRMLRETCSRKLVRKGKLSSIRSTRLKIRKLGWLRKTTKATLSTTRASNATLN